MCPGCAPITHLVCISSPSHNPQGQTELVAEPTLTFLHLITPVLSSPTHHSNATDTLHLRSSKPPANINELITQTAQLGLRQTRSRRFSEFRMEKSVCFLPFLNLQMLLSWHFPESTCSDFQHSPVSLDPCPHSLSSAELPHPGAGPGACPGHPSTEPCSPSLAPLLGVFVQHQADKNPCEIPPTAAGKLWKKAGWLYSSRWQLTKAVLLESN